MKTTRLTFLGFALFGSTTLFATVADYQGWGLSSETPSADVRAGSARTGRTIIGGGLHGGK
jgi:hypothetical protein